MSLTGLLFNLTMTTKKNILLQTNFYQTNIALSPTSMFQRLSLLACTGLLGTLLTFTVHHLILNFPVFKGFRLLKRRINTMTVRALYWLSMHPLL